MKKINKSEKKTLKNTQLKNFSICTSGYDEETNEKIIEEIKNFGGTYTENLLKKTNYLITDKINSFKALKAQENNILCVTKDWILTKEKNNLFNDEMFKIKCFQGINFFIFGFNEEEINKYSIKIIEKGGNIKNNINECDYILFKSNLEFTQKEIEEIHSISNKIVTEEWINNCINNNKFYKIKENYPLINQELNNKYEKCLKLIKTNQKLEELFLGKNFFIDGFDEKKIKLKIEKLINYCGGLITDELLSINDYVIVPLTHNKLPQIEEINNNYQPKKVIITWLFNSILNKKILDYNDFKPFLPIIKRDNEEEMYYFNKNKTISNLFLSITFTIYKETYSKEKFNEIKNKILQNSGTINDIKDADDFNDILKSQYIIVNDGYSNILNGLLEANEKNHKIVSHRFIDECIEKRELVDYEDYVYLLPLNFSVPIKEFQNLEVYFLNSCYTIWDIKDLEGLYETFGGTCNLSKNTKYIIIKDKKYSLKNFEKLKKKSNKDIKIINDDWISDCYLKNGEFQNPENYEVNLI